ncbi:MAG TPA: RNA-binding S4 domain-containing protein [Hydrogenophaga sp.]|uniref:RNA-binding S4 domain-containing protein n=1 Tax=Hydrogenophaga sp. TaxID=1904254 RepID=UPI002B71458B|nr:RNA-binding S4 domain-containing protein [Hydrogenophaga sp.]HMN92986.1 RNA-binding S4 domain-containing protein [Hydrogenophaga sp.]HMP09128.1 RNA-binding S4 domain-containing protein [Hydrogenophaga sp.]
MPAPQDPKEASGRIRLDKWLWAARFYKTRGLAGDEVARGRVQVNGSATKPAREVRIGDRIELQQGPLRRMVVVRALSGVRGPAPVAALLYEETAESVAERQRQAELRRLAPEPALAQTQGRPTKRERRTLDHWRQHDPAPDWDQRWSARLDDHEPRR